MYEKLGKAAVSFAAAYLRRRYRRHIRIGGALVGAAVGLAIYLANRNAPEG